MPKVEARYTETLKDGSECKLVFFIEAERMDGNVPEILSNFAQMSKSAYINLGNKMRYGTTEQNRKHCIGEAREDANGTGKGANVLFQ